VEVSVSAKVLYDLALADSLICEQNRSLGRMNDTDERGVGETLTSELAVLI